ncbi:hypothetical protein ACJWPW_25600, partial [Klebsiella pneumoniae]
EWVHVQLHQQKGMISLSPPTICNSAHHYHAFSHHNKGRPIYIQYFDAALDIPALSICRG